MELWELSSVLQFLVSVSCPFFTSRSAAAVRVFLTLYLWAFFGSLLGNIPGCFWWGNILRWFTCPLPLRDFVESLDIFILSRWLPCKSCKRFHGYTPKSNSQVHQTHIDNVELQPGIMRRLMSIIVDGILKLLCTAFCNQLRVQCMCWIRWKPSRSFGPVCLVRKTTTNLSCQILHKNDRKTFKWVWE